MLAGVTAWAWLAAQQQPFQVEQHKAGRIRRLNRDADSSCARGVTP